MALAIYLFIGLVTAVLFQGPKPIQDLDENEGRISAARVREQLIYLHGPEQAIHFGGTEANADVRFRLISRLKQLELDVWEIPFRTGELELVNVLARRRGTPTATPILVVSHYDSCRFGPGSGDALGCVAAMLESIRCLQTFGDNREVWFLFTDGEEAGLLGAQEFASKELPWGTKYPFVVNFDSRGSNGAACMFETHSGNFEHIRRLKEHLAWPRFTSSLMVDVYKQLPNKTDFTVFRNVKWPGFNFALIGGAHRYHTPEDTPDNLSNRSLQHFAEHSFRLMQALIAWQEEDWIQAESESKAVFFDLFATRIVSYPEYWNPFLTVLGWVLFFLVAVRFQAFSRIRLQHVIALFVVVLASTCLSALFGGMLSWLMKGRVIERRYVEFGEIGAVGYTFLAIFVCTTLGAWAFRKRNLYHARLAILFALNLLATFTTVKLAGGAYLFHWVTLLWCCLALVRPTRRWIDFIAIAFYGILHAPILTLLPIAMGLLGGTLLGGVGVISLFPLLVLYSEFPKDYVPIDLES